MICLDVQGPYKVLFNKKVVYRTRRRNVLKLDFRKCPVQKKVFLEKVNFLLIFCTQRVVDFYLNGKRHDSWVESLLIPLINSKYNHIENTPNMLQLRYCK